MPLFDDDDGGFWAAGFGMGPDEWRTAKDRAADQARQDYAAQTQAMAKDPSADDGSADGGGADKFKVAYAGRLQQLMAERAAGPGGAQQPPAPPQMRVSDNGLSLIQGIEKYRPKPYGDGDAGYDRLGS